MKFRNIALITLCVAFVIGIYIYRHDSVKTIIQEGSFPYMSKQDMMQTADVIIQGVVAEVLPSKWSNPEFIKGENIRNIIQTDILVKISEVLKGVPYDDSNIIVRIDKGIVGKVKLISNGYPDFKEGEEVILFLNLDDSDLSSLNENYYVLTGLNQSKFTLKYKDADEE